MNRISILKEVIYSVTNRVTESYNESEHYVMYGDTDNHYSWFPGPGEIKVTYSLKENKLNFSVDSNSLRAADLDSFEKFRKILNKIDFDRTVIETLFEIRGK